jgi:hypothetical protein
LDYDHATFANHPKKLRYHDLSSRQLTSRFLHGGLYHFRVLEKNGISILKGPEYSELSVEQRDQIPHIIQLLNANDISCVMADIVDQVYQG